MLIVNFGTKSEFIHESRRPHCKRAPDVTGALVLMKDMALLVEVNVYLKQTPGIL